MGEAGQKHTICTLQMGEGGLALESLRGPNLNDLSWLYLCVVCGGRVCPGGKLANGRFIGRYIKLWGREVGGGGGSPFQV